jgi:hypothetical protein
MARTRRRRPSQVDSLVKRPLPVSERILEPPEATLVDVIDHLLNTGVALTGDVTLGVAGVDLIYLRLSSLICATDRLNPTGRRAPRRGAHRRRVRRLR